MRIVHVPHPVLQSKVRPIISIDRKIQSLVKKMITTLEAEVDPEGVGLAANQVGYPIALFIMKPTPKSSVTVCINPKVVAQPEFPKKTTKPVAGKKKPRKSLRLEGCLSIPRLWGYVERTPWITLEYTTLEGTSLQKKFTGFEAVIVQHEMDHLKGVVFTQRVLEQKRKLYKEIEGELEPFTL